MNHSIITYLLQGVLTIVTLYREEMSADMMAIITGHLVMSAASILHIILSDPPSQHYHSLLHILQRDNLNIHENNWE